MLSITKYQIVGGNTRQEFEREVNDFIKCGWRLHGDTLFAPELVHHGVFQNSRREPIFLQPMVYYEMGKIVEQQPRGGNEK